MHAISFRRFLLALPLFLALPMAWTPAAVVLGLDPLDTPLPTGLTPTESSTLFGMPLDTQGLFTGEMPGELKEKQKFLSELQFLVDLKQYQKALQRIEGLIQLNPEAIWPRRVKGWILIQQGRYSLAERTARNMQAIKSDSPEALEILGYCAVQKKEHAEALAIYEQLALLSPEEPMARVRVGWLYQVLGETEKAREQLNKAVEIRPDHGLALDALGVLAYQDGQFGLAVQYHRRALAADPEQALVQNHLGSALFQIGRRDQAIAAYREAVRLAPRMTEARGNLGAALAAEGKHEEALEHLTRCLDQELNQGMAWHNFLLLIDPLLARAEGLDPTQPAANQSDWEAEQRALEIQGLEQNAQARHPLIRALRADFNNANLHHDLGERLAREGLEMPAALLFRSTLHLRPDHRAALASLERLLARAQGKTWVATLLEQWTQRMERQPTDPAVLSEMAMALSAQGKAEMAAERMAEAVGSSPSNITFRVELSRLYFANGQVDLARQHMEALTKTVPDAPEFHHRLAWLILQKKPVPAADAQLALEHALVANRAAGGRHLDFLQTLHEAYLATGDKEKARQTATQALELAESRGLGEVAARIRADMAK